MSDSSSSSGGVGFFGLLGVLFIGLKLGGVIAWPWVWVLAPLWGPLAVTAVVVIGLVGTILYVSDKRDVRRIR